MGSVKNSTSTPDRKFDVNEDGFKEGFKPFGISPLEKVANDIADGKSPTVEWARPWNESWSYHALNWISGLLYSPPIDPAIEGNRKFQIQLLEQQLKERPNPQCFLAGTPILMADGTEKPIEDIAIGDEVMSFDPKAVQGKGRHQARKVTRLFRNKANIIIDLQGLKMTPGHVVLSDKGDWLTIAAVLKADRAIVKDNNGRPIEVRARTGVPVGSPDDILLHVLFADPTTSRQRTARVRAGIPSIGRKVAKGYEAWSLRRVLEAQNYRLELDGTIIDADGKVFNATPWPGGTPFEVEIMHNWIVSVDGLSYIPQWIAELPMHDQKGLLAIAGGGTFPASLASPKQSNRRERRRMAAMV